MPLVKAEHFDGPIPGENYTSNPKDRPWFRPPEITNLDKGVEAVMKQLTTREGAFGILNSLQAGVTVVQATDMLVTSGIGAGKFTPDFALLLAGPVARIIKIMAEDAEIPYAMGTDDDPIPTISYYQKQADITRGQAETIGDNASQQIDNVMKPTDSPVPPASGGFMSAPQPTGPMT